MQDHPGHCLLVTAPLAQHNTPHHTTPHHTTPHHTTPHHTTPHHTTPHHTTPHHTTPHHTTPHHKEHNNTHLRDPPPNMWHPVVRRAVVSAGAVGLGYHITVCPGGLAMLRDVITMVVREWPQPRRLLRVHHMPQVSQDLDRRPRPIHVRCARLLEADRKQQHMIRGYRECVSVGTRLTRLFRWPWSPASLTVVPSSASSAREGVGWGGACVRLEDSVTLHDLRRPMLTRSWRQNGRW